MAEAHHRAATKEREIDMRIPIRWMIIISALSGLTASGCYTKIMTPQEFVSTQRFQSNNQFADNSYSINYHQPCTTCHSSTELNERSEELENYGVHSVHDGVILSSNLWMEPEEQPVILVPSPYWPKPYDPVNSWWPSLPTATSISSPGTGDGNRPRTDGATRDGNGNRDRSTPISNSTYTQPQTPVGGTTSVPSTPPPAVNIAPSTPPAQTKESGRNRDSSDNTKSSNRTRNDGTTRDDDGNRPR